MAPPGAGAAIGDGVPVPAVYVVGNAPNALATGTSRDGPRITALERLASGLQV